MSGADVEHLGDGVGNGWWAGRLRTGRRFLTVNRAGVRLGVARCPAQQPVRLGLRQRAEPQHPPRREPREAAA